MSEILTAVPMFAVGSPVRIAHAKHTRYGVIPGKRMKPGTFTVVTAGRFWSPAGFEYTLKAADGEIVYAWERFIRQG